MVKIKPLTPATVILIFISIGLFGCSQSPASNAERNENANRASTVLNSNTSNNNISVVPTGNQIGNQTPSVSNNATPTVDKKTSPAVKLPTPQIGGGGSDLSLFTQARAALSSDKELLNSVIVEIKDGNATLTGNVTSEAQKSKAGQLVQNVQGIKSVKNNLRVSS